MYEFHDKLPINDSLVHGFVVVRDDNGGIIFKKSNMVVNKGRESIIALINSTIFNTTDNNAFKTFSSIKFGSNYSMTTPETESINAIFEGEHPKYQYNISTSKNDGEALCEYDRSNRRFKISIDVEAKDTPAEIRELGLYFKKNDGTDVEHLFSRVVFDPIFCGANAAISKFTMTYYVYL